MKIRRSLLPVQRLEAVRAEMSLTVLAYNLKRVLNILGMKDLMNAVQSPAESERVGPFYRRSVWKRGDGRYH